MQNLFTGIRSRSTHTGKIAFDDLTVTYVRTRLFAAALTVLTMLLVKRHYSWATAAQLDWILAPTAKLVAWFTSANPVFESGVGYVDFAKGVIVAPGCAGINFMIMAFGLAAFWGLHHARQLPSQLAWLTLALAAAYGLTLIVNTVRIAISMTLYDANIYSGWLTAARVHRLAGVGVYLGALWLYFLGLRKLIALCCRWYHSRKPRESTLSSCWLVLAWYLVGAVGVPLANGAWKQDLASFVEHSATVTLTVLAFGALIMIMTRVFTFRAQLHRS